ncbi:MAG: acyl-CoA thioesterase domain-containing protein [Kiritimatiellia bacterium]
MKAPIMYEVERIRDGRSFTTRRIVAMQHKRPIFNMAVSFQIDEDGFEHQIEMPDVPGPDGMPSIIELRRKAAEQDPEIFREWPIGELPMRYMRYRIIYSATRRFQVAAAILWLDRKTAKIIFLATKFQNTPKSSSKKVQSWLNMSLNIKLSRCSFSFSGC